ncbi:MAG: nitrite reductase, partial [Thermanaerothrix sp.]|nr:nitrite reductase [Thermanaerothrix sp.]
MKRKWLLWIVMILAMEGLAACGVKTSTPSSPTLSVKNPTPTGVEASVNLALEGFRKGGCGACHIIPGVPGAQGTLAPDLSQIAEVAEERLKSGEYRGKAKSVIHYLYEVSTDPDVYLPSDCNGAPCQKGLM